MGHASTKNKNSISLYNLKDKLLSSYSCYGWLAKVLDLRHMVRVFRYKVVQKHHYVLYIFSVVQLLYQIGQPKMNWFTLVLEVQYLILYLVFILVGFWNNISQLEQLAKSYHFTHSMILNHFLRLFQNNMVSRSFMNGIFALCFTGFVILYVFGIERERSLQRCSYCQQCKVKNTFICCVSTLALQEL